MCMDNDDLLHSQRLPGKGGLQLPVFIPLGGPPAHLGQPGKLSLQGGYGGCGGLGVRVRRGKRWGPWRSGGAPAGAPVTCASPAAARGHPAQLLGSLVEQEGLSGHVVSLHTTDASTRAHKQVKRGGRWQIVAMKRRWPGGLSGPMRNSADRYRAVVGKAPKKPAFAAQLPHVTPSKGRSARMPTSAQAGTAGPLRRGHRCRPRRDPSNFSFAAIV